MTEAKKSTATDKRARPDARVVGLCGGIGSGKSTVAQLLRELGARVVDADAISHEVLEEPDVKQTVLRRWGRDLLTPAGKIDRVKLGKAVFATSEDVKDLERLIHPRVRAHMLRQIEGARRDPSVKVVVIDAPLILEGGIAGWCDTLVFVDSARTARLSRVAQRHGWDEATATRREEEQLPVEEKRRKCDRVVENFGSLEDLQRHVKELYDVLATS